MNTYAQNMREDARSPASAYIQFMTGRGREGYRTYAFVESEDDKVFYQLALTEYSHICYLGCGGKDGVFSVFNKLSADSQVDGNLFFVDRDTERPPFRFPEVLRTEAYSWESYACDPTYVGWLLQRKLRPNLTENEQVFVESQWSETLESSRGIFSKHTALCRTALVLNESLGMSEIKLWDRYVHFEGRIVPDANDSDWHSDKLEMAVSKGEDAHRIRRRELYFYNQPTQMVTQGKLLFNFLRKFVENVKITMNRSSTENLNSARAWIEFMPYTNSSLQFIRSYAVSRIGDPL